MLAEQTTSPPLDQLTPVADRDDLVAAIEAARGVFVEESVGRLRRDAPPAHASRARCSRSEPARVRASRSCAWRRRGRRHSAATTSCRRTSRASREPCSRTGSSWHRRPGRPARGGGRDRPGSRRGSHATMNAHLRLALAEETMFPPPAPSFRRRGEPPGSPRPSTLAAEQSMNSWHGGLGLGAIALGAAIASGSRPLGVVGLGFLLAWSATWLWTWLAERPVSLSVGLRPESAGEGDRVTLVAEVSRASRVLVGSIAVELTVGRLGARSLRLRGHGHVLTAELELGPLPRGMYVIDEAKVVVGDLLGLASVTPAVAFERTTLVVRPQLISARRALLRCRPRRRRRPQAAPAACRRVRLPLGSGVRAGRVPPPRPLADERTTWPADGQGARGHVSRRSRRAPRLRSGRRRRRIPRLRASTRRCGSRDRSCRRMPSAAVLRRWCRPVEAPCRSRCARRTRELGGAVMALAAAVPDAPCALARALAGIPSTGGELTVVTSTLDPAAFAAVLSVAGRRAVSVVWVDSASFAARPTRAEPGLLRLGAHGVPTAVVRHGDDLAVRALGAQGRSGRAWLGRSSPRSSEHLP